MGKIIRQNSITLKKYRISFLAVLLVVMFTDASWLLYMANDPFENVHVRNSFIAEVGSPADFDWIPGQPASGFLQETGNAPTVIVKAVRATIRSNSLSNFKKILILARHLEQGPGTGEGIMSNTVDTYQQILTTKRGFCSDYSQVMIGLGYAAMVPVREWGMSFDSFSGNGHAFNEVYDTILGKWVFFDSYDSFYVVDKLTNEPLSVLEFRSRLLHGQDENNLRIIPILPQRFSFKSNKHALDYYRKGADEMFLYYGNNVFSYDNEPFVKWLGKYSRALETVAAIILGVQPKIKIIASASNLESIEELFSLRNRVLIGIGFLLLGGLLVMYLSWKIYRGKQSR